MNLVWSHWEIIDVLFCSEAAVAESTVLKYSFEVFVLT